MHYSHLVEPIKYTPMKITINICALLYGATIICSSHQSLGHTGSTLPEAHWDRCCETNESMREIFTSSSSRFLFLPPPLFPPFISAMVIRWVVWPSSLLFPDILTPRVNRSESPGSFTQAIHFHTPFCLTNMLETNLQQVGPASLKHEAFRLTGRRPGGNLWCHCTANVLFNSVFSYWPAVSRKLQWLCMLINIPTELPRLHLSLITMCKYEDSPVIDVNHTANAGRERLAIK